MHSTSRHAEAEITWLFVHGAGSSHEFWTGQRAAFPGSQAWDLPGHAAIHRTHGPAAPRPAPPLPSITIAAYAGWVDEQVRAAGRRDVVLVGHSMGGAIAQTLGLHQPPWLRGLVLANTGARLRVAPALLALLETDYPAAVEQIIHWYFAPEVSPYRREGVRRQLLRTDPAVTLGDFRACNDWDVRAALQAGGIRVPTLVISSRTDQMTPPKQSEFLAEAIPGAALTWVSHAGHMTPLEQPAAWNAAALAWADSHALRPPAAALPESGNAAEDG
jgi:pimeloyl-ACP methyl ester carboxylesterase